MLARCACPTASTYSTAAIADRERANHIVSVPRLPSINAEAQRRPERFETNDSVPKPVRSTENLAIRAAWPYIFGNIVRVTYAYQEDRARQGSRAIAADITGIYRKQ